MVWVRKYDETKKGVRKLNGILKTMSVTALFIIPSNALAIEGKDFSGSYFCTADAAGGVSYNDTSKKWEGTVFRVEDRYILKVEFFREVKRDWAAFNNAYFVTLSEHGNKATDILESTNYTNDNNLREINPLISYISAAGSFSCQIVLGTLEVNLSTGRFLKTYNWGYVDGADNNDNTPFIQIGKCSLID